jgi:hypothetical protein
VWEPRQRLVALAVKRVVGAMAGAPIKLR